jgi:hypothetical protein
MAMERVRRTTGPVPALVGCSSSGGMLAQIHPCQRLSRCPTRSRQLARPPHRHCPMSARTVPSAVAASATLVASARRALCPPPAEPSWVPCTAPHRLLAASPNHMPWHSVAKCGDAPAVTVTPPARQPIVSAGIAIARISTRHPSRPVLGGLKSTVFAGSCPSSRCVHAFHPACTASRSSW